MRTSIALLIAISAIFILTACSSSDAASDSRAGANLASVAYADLPAGIGRGFPVVLVDSDERRRADLAPGAPAPDFAMQLEDGSALRLSDLRDRPVMINFWATWCMPCRIEMPDIVREANLDSELVVIAANVQESVEAIEPFAEEFGMSMPIALDSDGKLRDLYLIRGMPTTFFVDRQGNISTIWEGPLAPDQLQQHLDGIR